MLNHRSIHAIASGAALLILALAVVPDIATAGDEAKYPDLRGQWMGVLRTRPGLPGQPSFDASKPWGKGQEAPLTAEYQAILEGGSQRRRLADAHEKRPAGAGPALFHGGAELGARRAAEPTVAIFVVANGEFGAR